MGNPLPHQHYLPVLAHYKISRLVTKVGFKLRPAGPHAFKKAGGGKAHKSTSRAKSGGKSARK